MQNITFVTDKSIRENKKFSQKHITPTTPAVMAIGEVTSFKLEAHFTGTFIVVNLTTAEQKLN